jgi:hypothetical protein
MPNKENPDVVELLRASYAPVAGALAELQSLLSLPSGYQRDLQYTKEPMLRALRRGLDALALLPDLIVGLRWNEARLRAAIDPAMYATDVAIEQARAGVPFRVAYQAAAADSDCCRDARRSGASKRGARRVPPPTCAWTCCGRGCTRCRRSAPGADDTAAAAQPAGSVFCRSDSAYQSHASREVHRDREHPEQRRGAQHERVVVALHQHVEHGVGAGLQRAEQHRAGRGAERRACVARDEQRGGYRCHEIGAREPEVLRERDQQQVEQREREPDESVLDRMQAQPRDGLEQEQRQNTSAEISTPYFPARAFCW